jgi:hypothetical protein
MEDASGVIWTGSLEGWFYSTDFVDIGIKDVKQYYVSETRQLLGAQRCKSKKRTLRS